jgi:hypothetical protein
VGSARLFVDVWLTEIASIVLQSRSCNRFSLLLSINDVVRGIVASVFVWVVLSAHFYGTKVQHSDPTEDRRGSGA